VCCVLIEFFLLLLLQNAGFYTQYGKKAVEVVLEILRALPVDFVSSPDIGFLKSIARQSNKATKVIFQLLDAMDVEPQTKQPYGIIVKDLVAIKSFASGIMVPKEFILPVKPDKYLGLPTTLVADAHKLGLEVYASGFANDLFSSYSYNYDPTAEYLQFIDSRDSVDGVVTDFPTTASNAIGEITNLKSPTSSS
jgi:glycerophosphoryl diester phosphodiesterase